MTSSGAAARAGADAQTARAEAEGARPAAEGAAAHQEAADAAEGEPQAGNHPGGGQRSFIWFNCFLWGQLNIDQIKCYTTTTSTTTQCIQFYLFTRLLFAGRATLQLGCYLLFGFGS